MLWFGPVLGQEPHVSIFVINDRAGSAHEMPQDSKKRARWWEGRKQWGGLVNVSRTLAIRVREFSDDAAVDPRVFGGLDHVHTWHVLC